MTLVWVVLLGAFIGWVNSLVVRSDSNEWILIDVLVGALGAVILARAFGNNTAFDTLLAAFLGAFVALAVLYAIRRTMTFRQADGRTRAGKDDKLG